MDRKKHSEPNHSSSGQGQRFVDAARELACDENEAQFEDALRKIAKQKPPPDDGAEKAPKKPEPKKPGQ
jgi:hypothetical protein